MFTIPTRMFQIIFSHRWLVGVKCFQNFIFLYNWIMYIFKKFKLWWSLNLLVIVLSIGGYGGPLGFVLQFGDNLGDLLFNYGFHRS